MQDPSAPYAAVPPRLPEQEKLRCPRCESTNTKFCYYNNYNLSQPRHYCKSCRRYWTKGGSLRNIPVGGGSRKNSKRSSTASITDSSTAAKRSSNAAQKPEPISGVGFSGGLDLPASVGGFASLSLASNGNVQLGNLSQAGGDGGGGSAVGLVQYGGESTTGCWGGGSNIGWTDLAIFTPASRFM